MQCAVDYQTSDAIFPPTLVAVPTAELVTIFVRAFVGHAARWWKYGADMRLTQGELNARIGEGDGAVPILIVDHNRNDRHQINAQDLDNWLDRILSAIVANPGARIVLTATIRCGAIVTKMSSDYTP